MDEDPPETTMGCLAELIGNLCSILGKVILVALILGAIYALISGIHWMWTHPAF